MIITKTMDYFILIEKLLHCGKSRPEENLDLKSLK